MTEQPWLDVSIPIRSGMVRWPGDPNVEVKRIADMNHGSVCNVSHFSMAVHAGTHMDAPLHFIANGKGMEALAFDAVIGEARVIQINDPLAVTTAECRQHNILPGERILFRTRNSELGSTEAFREDFVYISADAAHYLAEKQIRLVGIDYMSVGGFTKDGPETHQALLKAGIWIVENLDLTAIIPGYYDMICLPLKIENCDGAPARALLRRRA